MRAMYITAAPTGAVPKYVCPEEPKFIPCTEDGPSPEFVSRLIGDGWRSVGVGGLVLTSGEKGNGSRKVVESSVLLAITDLSLLREIVISLTGQGWQARPETGGLLWSHSVLHSYLPPAIASLLKEGFPDVFQALLLGGWVEVGSGIWKSMHACSAWVPIEPEAIVRESLAAIDNGASIVHLHTRALDDSKELWVENVKSTVTLGAQQNHIDVIQYDYILERLYLDAPRAILNVSTSVRGSGKDFDSPIRRAHVVRHARTNKSPDMCSLSPGPVIFQAGGGYENNHSFLLQQLKRCDEVGTRPEIEIFNIEILDSLMASYSSVIAKVGCPILIMLVAGVDQYRRGLDGSLSDSSLVTPAQRKLATALLNEGAEGCKALAAQIIVNALRPYVNTIRSIGPEVRVSALLPGVLQSVLAEVAVELELDGVRVGLEDALTVMDPLVPGGIRKGTTADQVKFIRERLEDLGVSVLTPDQTRDQIKMPREH